MGSSLALATYLKNKGHIVHVITPNEYPTFLNWMYGNSDAIRFTGIFLIKKIFNYSSLNNKKTIDKEFNGKN